MYTRLKKQVPACAHVGEPSPLHTGGAWRGVREKEAVCRLAASASCFIKQRSLGNELRGHDTSPVHASRECTKCKQRTCDPWDAGEAAKVRMNLKEESLLHVAQSLMIPCT